MPTLIAPNRIHGISSIAACKEIQDILKTLHSANAELSGFIKSFSKDSAAKLKSMAFDPEALSQRKLPYERLDQLVTELLLGVI